MTVAEAEAEAEDGGAVDVLCQEVGEAMSA
jgi:hypothetical protein